MINRRFIDLVVELTPLQILFTILLITGCSSHSQTLQAEQAKLESTTKIRNETYDQLRIMMRSYEGKHYNGLVGWLGPPSQILDDNKGGKILVFTKKETLVRPGHSTAYASGYGHGGVGTAFYTSRNYPATTHTIGLHLIFWINPQGYVYKSELKEL
jgi:hypothetical protein